MRIEIEVNKMRPLAMAAGAAAPTKLMNKERQNDTTISLSIYNYTASVPLLLLQHMKKHVPQ